MGFLDDLLGNQFLINGTNLPQRKNINLTGSGITATDDPTNNRTNLTIAVNAGGGGVTNAQLAPMAGTTLKGNPTNVSGQPQDIAAAADNTLLKRVGGVLSFAQVATADIAANAVTFAKMQTAGPASVLANATSSTAAVAALAASADGQVLQRSGGALVFGTLLASIIAGVTNASNAPAGFIGESLSVSNTTGVVLTNNVDAVLASLSLSAGDWDAEAGFVFSAPSTNATGTGIRAQLVAGSSITGTLGTPGWAVDPRVPSVGTNNALALTPSTVRFNVSSTTTINALGRASFSAGTVTGYAYMSARRVR